MTLRWCASRHWYIKLVLTGCLEYDYLFLSKANRMQCCVPGVWRCEFVVPWLGCNFPLGNSLTSVKMVTVC